MTASGRYPSWPTANDHVPRKDPNYEDDPFQERASKPRKASSVGIAYSQGRAARGGLLVQAASLLRGRRGLGTLGRTKARDRAGPGPKRGTQGLPAPCG